MGRLESLIQDIQGGKLNFLFIGPGGSGKTHAAASLIGPTLFLDAEGGLRTVLKLNAERSKLHLPPHRMITIPRDRPWRFIMEVLPELLTQATYPTICWDSLTMLSDHLLREITGTEPDPKMTLRSYGTTIDRMKQLVYKASTAKANTIFIAQEASIIDEDGKLTSFVPNVAGKETFARQLPAMVDEVWWFTTKSEFNKATNKRDITRRVILTAPTGLRIGKDRDGVLNLEEELDFDLLRKKLQL